MSYIISASTHTGNIKKTNQDSYVVRRYETQRGQVVLAVICDGMGGLQKGELASTTVVNEFLKWSDNNLLSFIEGGCQDGVIREQWKNVVINCNEKIQNYGKHSGITLGTTISAILLTEKEYWIINVGDSRVYRLRDGVQQLTEDHSVVAKDIRDGRITPEQAAVDVRRSVLLQCIGASETVYPDVFHGMTEPNTTYMLCSDGFHHELSDQEIWTYMSANACTDAGTMKRNIEYLISLDMSRNERDNITALLIKKC